MRLLWSIIVVATLSSSGCSEVPYHEKRKLGRRIMPLEGNDLETSDQNKVFFSREVSGGKPGHSATGVFVLGADEGMALVEKLEGVHALIVAADGSLHLSPGLRK